MDPLADADDDGLNNLFEFGIGTNPLVSEGNEGVGAIPKLRVMPDSAPASFYYEFVTARTLPPGVQLEVLQSSTLNASDWEIIASRQGNEPWAGSAVAAGKLEEVAVVEEEKTQVRILENDLKDVALRFYRLQVVVSPDHALAEKVAWRWK